LKIVDCKLLIADKWSLARRGMQTVASKALSKFVLTAKLRPNVNMNRPRSQLTINNYQSSITSAVRIQSAGIELAIDFWPGGSFTEI
jgi:hypothetical protein